MVIGSGRGRRRRIDTALTQLRGGRRAKSLQCNWPGSESECVRTGHNTQLLLRRSPPASVGHPGTSEAPTRGVGIFVGRHGRIRGDCRDSARSCRFATSTGSYLLGDRRTRTEEGGAILQTSAFLQRSRRNLNGDGPHGRHPMTAGQVPLHVRHVTPSAATRYDVSLPTRSGFPTGRLLTP
jgi:hypothetical protein